MLQSLDFAVLGCLCSVRCSVCAQVLWAMSAFLDSRAFEAETSTTATNKEKMQKGKGGERKHVDTLKHEKTPMTPTTPLHAAACLKRVPELAAKKCKVKQEIAPEAPPPVVEKAKPKGKIPLRATPKPKANASKRHAEDASDASSSQCMRQEALFVISQSSSSHCVRRCWIIVFRVC